MSATRDQHSYDELPYLVRSYAQSAPDRLATLARLHGLITPPVTGYSIWTWWIIRPAPFDRLRRRCRLRRNYVSEPFIVVGVNTSRGVEAG